MKGKFDGGPRAMGLGLVATLHRKESVRGQHSVVDQNKNKHNKFEYLINLIG